jgi:hypothetical protein
MYPFICPHSRFLFLHLSLPSLSLYLLSLSQSVHILSVDETSIVSKIPAILLLQDMLNDQSL